MTDLLILPGFSLKNRDWATQMAQELQPQFGAKIWGWKHWQSGDNADFSAELEARAIITQLKKKKDEPVHVLAKSIGTWVLSKIIKQSPNLFAKIILCGVPLNDLEKHEWNDYKNFKNVTSPTICFQNDADPHGNFAQVSQLFTDEKIDIPLVEKSGNNHDYNYSSDFQLFLSKK